MYASYIRRSLNRMVNSSERQRDEIERWAMENGVSIDREFEEMPISGSKSISERPSLAAALHELKEGDTLVVADITRLSRNQTHFGLIMGMLHQKGAKIAFADGHIYDEECITSRLMTNILAFCSELERNNIRLRVKQGMRVAMKTKAMGNRETVKFGWRNEGGVKVKHDLEQQIGTFIKQSREKRVRIKTIQHELNKRCWFNRKGKPFSQPAITRIANTFEIGLTV